MKQIKKSLYFILYISLFTLYFTSCSMYKEKLVTGKKDTKKQAAIVKDKSKSEKGYNLPIKKEEKERVEKECLSAMKLIENIYAEEGFEDFDSAVLSRTAETKMIKKLKQMKQPLISSSLHFNMIYYNKMEQFLSEVEKGKKSNVILYQLQSDGGIGRSEFTYN